MTMKTCNLGRQSCGTSGGRDGWDAATGVKSVSFGRRRNGNNVEIKGEWSEGDGQLRGAPVYSRVMRL
jgi:hypothetical protein